MKDKDISKELSEIAPSLNKLSKKEHYPVPNNYFDSLPDAVWNKIEESYVEEQTSNIVPLAKKILAVAASLAILFFITKGLSTQSQTTDEIPLETIVEFVMEDVSDLDEVFLSEIYEETFDLAESEDATFDFIQEEGLDDIDDQFLQTLY